MDPSDSPRISALFQVVFDQKVGYTLSWKRTISEDLGLSGVEYKSLPSGLHGIQSDIVYFIQDDQHIGISAFAQEKSDQAHRNAKFCAVGALVPLSQGRLGRSWFLAPDLRRLAGELLQRPSDLRGMELYWKQHRQTDTAPTRSEISATPDDSLQTAGGRRKRGFSDATSILASRHPSDHPGLYISAFLDSFGPLVFPLHRAALFRKRVLLLGVPPVQRNCNAVYILSVLSTLPESLTDVLPVSADSIFRTQPLFSVGISDILALTELKGRAGWIATSTDDILAEKHQLYDFIVDLAPTESGSKRRWPRIRKADGTVVKASQRDLRRYRRLRANLEALKTARERYRDDEDGDDQAEPTHDSAPLLASPIRPDSAVPMDEHLRHGEHEVVEPERWSTVAYNAFWWWASAGSAAAAAVADGEAKSDATLLADLPDLHDAVRTATPSTAGSEHGQEIADAQETATVVTAYFHRLTAQIFQSLAEVVADADDETDGRGSEDGIVVTAEDMREMGLDASSAFDREVVEGLLKLYFTRTARVAEADGVWVCGMRVC